MMKNEMMLAKLNANEIPVTHSVFENKEFLKFSITGWDEVKRLTKKVLTFEGRRFTFSCWNSDDMYCIFSRSITGDAPAVAFVTEKVHPVINALPSKVHSGDWHDKPLKWEVITGNERQLFATIREARIYAGIRRRAYSEGDAIREYSATA